MADLIPPGPPRNAKATAKGGVVTVKWDDPEDGKTMEVTGYRVDCEGEASRTAAGRANTSMSYLNLKPGESYVFSIVALGAGTASDPANADAIVAPAHAASIVWMFLSWVIIGLFGAFAGVSLILWGKLGPYDQTWYSLALASGTIAIGFLIITAIHGGSNNYGLFSMVVGADGRVSTSKAQVALWTALVAFAMAYFGSLTALAGRKGLFDGFAIGSQTTTTSVWDDYLILLGGPFLSLVLAKGIVSAKVDSGILQKSVTPDGTASITQALTNDAGDVDLVDSQYLLFNLIAFVYVILGLARYARLPEIPPLLLAMTSTGAATYVINKSLESNRPRLTSVVPSQAAPGDTIIVAGQNLCPEGSIDATPTVMIDGVRAQAVAPATPSALTVQVPLGLANGAKPVTVTTTARVVSDSLTLQILSKTPQILGIEPHPVGSGQSLTISGYGLVALQGPQKVSVTFDSDAPIMREVTINNGIDTVSVDAPAAIGDHTIGITPVGATATVTSSVTVV